MNNEVAQTPAPVQEIKEAPVPAKVLSFKEMLRSPGTAQKIMTSAGGDEKNALRYQVGFIEAMNKNKDLAKCSPESLVGALIDSIVLEMPIDGNDYAYLYPYGTKAKLHVSYFGYIKRLKDFYPSAIINCELVYEGDDFDWEDKNGDIHYYHKPKDFFREKTEKDFKGVFVVVQFKNKDGKWVSLSDRLNKKDIENARKSSKNGGAVWNKYFEAMAKKVAIRRCLKIHLKQEFKDLNEKDNDDYEIKEIKQKEENFDYGSSKKIEGAQSEPMVIEAKVDDSTNDKKEPVLAENKEVEGDSVKPKIEMRNAVDVCKKFLACETLEDLEIVEREFVSHCMELREAGGEFYTNKQREKMNNAFNGMKAVFNKKKEKENEE